MTPFPRALSLRRPTLSTAKGVATLAVRGTAQLPAGTATTLRLYRGSTAAGVSPSITLPQAGTSFRGALRVGQTARPQVVLVQARATVPAGTETCTPTFRVPCVGATRAAIALRSDTFRLVIPAR